MATRRVDVLIIGAGTAGLAAYREISKHTHSYALVNDGPWGTMCARVGCMPSKALVEVATAFQRRAAFAAFGIRGGELLTIDRAAALAHVRALRDQFVEETCKLTADLGDRAISGRAQLLDGHRVRVGADEITADRIILAPGSRPAVPDRWAAFTDRLLTTDSLFEQATLPDRIAVLGLGPLGAELAQALARLGSTVTAFDAKPTIAGLTDAKVNAALLAALRTDVTIHLGHEVELARDGEALRVTAGDVSVTVDRVLVALGRTPNLAGLGLETLGVPLDAAGRPEVDPATMRIGDTDVFLVGDAAGDRPIQHEAADEGHIAGLNARTPVVRRYQRRTPLAIVFTEPSVALVGVHHAGLDPDTTVAGDASFVDQGRARLGLRGAGCVRLYANTESGALVGAELCAPEGEHLAHLLALAIERGSTVVDLLRAPLYHPTLEEGLREALHALAKQLPDPGGFELASEPA